jgi:broad specificity phosphatase PhoE
VTPFYFIRHGETDWNAQGRLQGQHDIPLNALGRRQAAEAGQKLRDLRLPAQSMPWLVSPLSRTRETAEIAREAIGLDPRLYERDDRLKELTFGAWEGRTWKELRAVDSAAVEARAEKKWDYVPPEGESYAMLSARVASWLPVLAEPSIIVSHGGVARVLLVLLAGWDPEEAAGADVWQGRVLTFEAGRAQWT